jgi:hypothetical protein
LAVGSQQMVKKIAVLSARQRFPLSKVSIITLLEDISTVPHAPGVCNLLQTSICRCSTGPPPGFTDKQVMSDLI